MDAAKSSAALSHWDVPVGVVDSCSLYVCVAGENREKEGKGTEERDRQDNRRNINENSPQ